MKKARALILGGMLALASLATPHSEALPMPSVPQPPATREHLDTLIAELYGTPHTPTHLSTAGPRWQQAVAQVEAHLCATLRVEVLPERQRKALDLVRADAVTLHADGTASVTSGKQTYTLAPDCPCADAKHRAELCKHAVRRDNENRIPSKGGWESEKRPRGQPPDLMPKGEGTRAWRKSGKRREGAEGAVPQALHDMVKAALLEAQFPVGPLQTHWQSA